MSVISIGQHKLTCASLTDPVVDSMLARDKVDVLFSDPPWGDGNLKYWVTMNKKMTGKEFSALTNDQMYARIGELVERYVTGNVFIETGPRWQEYVEGWMRDLGLRDIRSVGLMYRAGAVLLPNVLVHGAKPNGRPFTITPSDLRGADLSKACIANVAVPGGIVLDPCCGMGYSARAAVAAEMRFRGNEFNSKRLQKTIDFLSKAAG